MAWIVKEEVMAEQNDQKRWLKIWLMIYPSLCDTLGGSAHLLPVILTIPLARILSQLAKNRFDVVQRVCSLVLRKSQLNIATVARAPRLSFQPALLQKIN